MPSPYRVQWITANNFILPYCNDSALIQSHVNSSPDVVKFVKVAGALPYGNNLQLTIMANTSQLYLLADHIKLSLLERQRAISLDLEPTTRDGHISRLLDSMREGIEALEHEEAHLREDHDSSVCSECFVHLS